MSAINISAKEKAKELVDKMLHCYQGNIDEYTAKQCASIAVDEILNVLFQHHEIDYWKEVKKELELL